MNIEQIDFKCFTLNFTDILINEQFSPTMYRFSPLLGNVTISHTKFCGISEEWQFESIGRKLVKGYKYEERKTWIDLGETFSIKIFLAVIKYFMSF